MYVKVVLIRSCSVISLKIVPLHFIMVTNARAVGHLNNAGIKKDFSSNYEMNVQSE